MTRAQQWLVLVVCCLLAVLAIGYFFGFGELILPLAAPIVLIGVGLFAFLAKPRQL